MLSRKDVFASLAACAVAATTSLALADSNKSALTLDAAAADTNPNTSPLMMGLDKLGAAKPLNAAGINVYGWVEAGYAANLRNTGGLKDTPRIVGGTFTQQPQNRFELNQVDFRVERVVDTNKPWDVGGMVEFLYGTDGNYIHANGLEYGNSGSEDLYNPEMQFDIPQFYLDISIGKQWKFRGGKFVTLVSYETLAPATNPFYSHSYIFSTLPFTQFGGYATYTMSDQWAFTAGVSRGWDQAFKDNNDCAIDGLFQIAYTPNKQLQVYLNGIVGPENANNTSNYRTVINPVVVWKPTDRLSFAADALYLYDGGINDGSYGDAWGAALYAGYKLTDDGMFTLNGRIEKLHDYRGAAGITANLPRDLGAGLTGPTNYYEITMGVTIKPFPKDPIGSNLIIRPEIRYDFTDRSADLFPAGATASFRDQWSAAVDVIFTY